MIFQRTISRTYKYALLAVVLGFAVLGFGEAVDKTTVGIQKLASTVSTSTFLK